MFNYVDASRGGNKEYSPLKVRSLYVSEFCGVCTIFVGGRGVDLSSLAQLIARPFAQMQ